MLQDYDSPKLVEKLTGLNDEKMDRDWLRNRNGALCCNRQRATGHSWYIEAAGPEFANTGSRRADRSDGNSHCNSTSAQPG